MAGIALSVWRKNRRRPDGAGITRHPRVLVALFAVSLLAVAVALTAGAEAQGRSDSVRLEQSRAELARAERQHNTREERLREVERELESLAVRITTSEQRLALLDGQSARLEQAHGSASARLLELEGLRKGSVWAKTQRVAEIYRRSRLGRQALSSPRPDRIRALRSARYLAAIAALNDGVDEETEAEEGGRLVSVDQARRRLESVALERSRLEADLEADRSRKSETALEVERLRSEVAAGALKLSRLRDAEARLAAAMPPAAYPGYNDPASRAREDAALATAATARAAGRPGDGAVASAQASDPGAVASSAPSSDAQPVEDGESGGLGVGRLFGGLFGSEPEPPAFETRKGQLPAPVRGSVVARFGQKHANGAVYQGVIVRTEAGAIVRAVAQGKVVFAGDFKGLGKTLIVSHGDRYHSVYARMSFLRSSMDSTVRPGQGIGRMSLHDADLHFELRNAGKSFDPLPWLAGGEAAFLK